MKSLGADKSEWLWHLDMEKRCNGKDYKAYLRRDAHTTIIYNISGKHFMSSFKTNGEDLKKKGRRILSSEVGFL